MNIILLNIVFQDIGNHFSNGHKFNRDLSRFVQYIHWRIHIYNIRLEKKGSL